LTINYYFQNYSNVDNLKIILIKTLLFLLTNSSPILYGQIALDESFGNRGVLLLSSASLDDIVIRPDEKIVLGVKTFSERTSKVALVCFNPDGTLDVSFGGQGTGATPSIPRIILSSLKTTPSNKIISTGTLSSSFAEDSAFIGRYQDNGLRDATFAENKFVKIPSSCSKDIALSSNHRIIILGEKQTIRNDKSFLASYFEDGSLNTTFGTNGMILSPPFVQFNAFALGPDNKIIVIGSTVSAQPDDPTHSFFIRYNENGTVDTTLNTEGKVTLPSDKKIVSVVIQADHKIIITGSQHLPSGKVAFIARYNPDGSPDTTFGPHGNGTITEPLFKTFTKVVLLPNNNLVVTSFRNEEYPYKNSFTCYDQNGLLDTTFSLNGTAILSLPANIYNAHLLLSPHNTLLIAGNKITPGEMPRITIIRYKFLTPAEIEQKRLEDLAAQIAQEIRHLMYIGLQEQCSICLEEEDINTLQETPCHHFFHLSCLNRWRTSGNEASFECPFCRQFIGIDEE